MIGDEPLPMPAHLSPRPGSTAHARHKTRSLSLSNRIEAGPFIFDGATSITQRGKFEVYARAEKWGPRVGQSINKEITTRILMKSSKGWARTQRPCCRWRRPGELGGGYKGYDLADHRRNSFFSLQPGRSLTRLTGFDKRQQPALQIGHFFMAINYFDAFLVTWPVLRAPRRNRARLRASKRAPGQEGSTLPAKKNMKNEEKVREQGVATNPQPQKEIKTFLQKNVGLEPV